MLSLCCRKVTYAGRESASEFFYSKINKIITDRKSFKQLYKSYYSEDVFTQNQVKHLNALCMYFNVKTLFFPILGCPNQKNVKRTRIHVRSTLGIDNFCLIFKTLLSQNVHFVLVVDNYCLLQLINHYYDIGNLVFDYVYRYPLFMHRIILQYCSN